MIIAIVSTIVGLILTGITTLAFKNPISYARIYLYLLAIDIFVFIGLIIWDTAVSNTEIKILQFIQNEKIDFAEKAANGIKIDSIYIFIIFCIALYLVSLPHIYKIINQKD